MAIRQILEYPQKEYTICQTVKESKNSAVKNWFYTLILGKIMDGGKNEKS